MIARMTKNTIPNQNPKSFLSLSVSFIQHLLLVFVEVKPIRQDKLASV